MTLPKVGLNLSTPLKTVSSPAQTSAPATARPLGTVAQRLATDGFDAPVAKAPVSLDTGRTTFSVMGRSRSPVAPPPPGGGLDSGQV